MKIQKNLVPLLLVLAGIAFVGTITAATVQTSLFAQVDEHRPAANIKPNTEGATRLEIHTICQDALNAAKQYKDELENIINNLKKDYPGADLEFLDQYITVIEQNITNLKSKALNCSGDFEEEIGAIVDTISVTFGEVYKSVEKFTAKSDIKAALDDFKNITSSCTTKKEELDTVRKRLKFLNKPNLGVNVSKLLEQLDASYKKQCVEFVNTLKADLEKSDSVTYWKDAATFWQEDEIFWAVQGKLTKALDAIRFMIDATTMVDGFKNEVVEMKKDLIAAQKDTEQTTGAQDNIKKLEAILQQAESLVKEAEETLKQNTPDKDKLQLIEETIQTQIRKPWEATLKIIYNNLELEHLKKEINKISQYVTDTRETIKKYLDEQKITQEQGKICSSHIGRIEEQVGKISKAIDAGNIDEAKKMLEELKILLSRAYAQCPLASGQTQPETERIVTKNTNQSSTNNGQSQACQEYREGIVAIENEINETIKNLVDTFGSLSSDLKKKSDELTALINRFKKLLPNCESEVRLKELSDNIIAEAQNFKKEAETFASEQSQIAMENEHKVVKRQCEAVTKQVTELKKHIEEKTNIKEIIELRKDFKKVETTSKALCVTLISKIEKALKNAEAAYWDLDKGFWQDNAKFWDTVQVISDKLEAIQAKLEAKKSLDEVQTSICPDIEAAYREIAEKQRSELINNIYQSVKCKSELINKMQAALTNENFKEFDLVYTQYAQKNDQFWPEAQRIDFLVRLNSLKEGYTTIVADKAALKAELKNKQIEFTAAQESAFTKDEAAYSALSTQAEEAVKQLDEAKMTLVEKQVDSLVDGYYKRLDIISADAEKQIIQAEVADAIATVKGYALENDQMLVDKQITALENRNCHVAAKNVEAVGEKLRKTNDLATKRKLIEQLHGRVATAKKECGIDRSANRSQ